MALLCRAARIERHIARLSGSLSLHTRKLVLFLIWNSVAIPLICYLVYHRDVRDTLIPHLRRLATVQQDEDSWGPMQVAYDYLSTRSRDDPPVYSKILFGRIAKFQYPTTSLLIYSVLDPLTERFGGGQPEALRRALHWISWCAFALLLLVVVRLYEPLAENGADSSTIDRTVQKLVVGIGVITFYPALKAYSLGQIQTWINTLFALMLTCWINNRYRAAGVLGGIACLIKPQYGLLLLWGAARGKWRFAIPFAAVIFAGVVLTAAVFGTSDLIEYPWALSIISKCGEAYFPNQSVNGLLNRMLNKGSNLVWTPNDFAPYHPWVYGISTLTSFLLLAAALFPASGARGGPIDFCVMALTLTIASPVAWEHHYGMLLPIFAMLLPLLWRRPVFGRATIPYLAVSYMLCSNYLPVSKAFARTPLNFLQSYLLAGALMVLIALYRVRAQTAPADRSAIMPGRA
jgi:hypothetical protein